MPTLAIGDIGKKNTVALISVFPLYTGTTTVVSDYSEALSKMGFNVNVYQLTFPYTNKNYINSTYKIEGKKFLLKDLELPYNIIFHLPKKLPRISDDIVILTDPVLLSLKRNFPDSIIIFHDLRDLDKYNYNPIRKIFYLYLMKFLDNNDKIIAVSNLTERTVKSISRKKLNVQTVEGCSRFNFDMSSVYERIKAIKMGKKEINVLYVAADRPYKNIKTFIKIAETLNQTYSGANFHFILVSKLRDSTKRFVNKKQLLNLEIIDVVENLYNIYELTDIFLFPSLIEGFGLPLVEAMSFGIPIIYSNKPPMTDIVGDYGIRVDPFDVDSWVEELIRLMDVKNYEKMALLSYERSKYYTFDEFKDRLSKALKIFNFL
ncbi:MAG: glycosyltransferase [Candidatus Thermoplasmatota archaeon]|nr:glycosyltransferase [Candidatus Thermoplasmatota archaeon]